MNQKEARMVIEEPKRVLRHILCCPRSSDGGPGAKLARLEKARAHFLRTLSPQVIVTVAEPLSKVQAEIAQLRALSASSKQKQEAQGA